jgi:hypothetical protein
VQQDEPQRVSGGKRNGARSAAQHFDRGGNRARTKTTLRLQKLQAARPTLDVVWTKKLPGGASSAWLAEGAEVPYTLTWRGVNERGAQLETTAEADRWIQMGMVLRRW